MNPLPSEEPTFKSVDTSVSTYTSRLEMEHQTDSKFGNPRLSAKEPAPSIRFWPAIGRASRRKCPRCGEGDLFRSYLHQVESCKVCGESYGKIHADDGPAWLTIGIVGHLVVPMALFAETHSQWPLALSMTLWPLLALGLTLAVLPLAKAAFIAAIWVTKAPGIE